MRAGIRHEFVIPHQFPMWTDLICIANGFSWLKSTQSQPFRRKSLRLHYYTFQLVFLADFSWFRNADLEILLSISAGLSQRITNIPGHLAMQCRHAAYEEHFFKTSLVGFELNTAMSPSSFCLFSLQLQHKARSRSQQIRLLQGNQLCRPKSQTYAHTRTHMQLKSNA